MHFSSPFQTRLPGDVAGGFASALINLPHTIALGVLTFAVLGPAYGGMGILAGLYASIVSAAVSALAGGSRIQVSGPRASVAVVLGSALAGFAADPALQSLGPSHVPAALALTFLCLLLSGVFQIGFGLLGLGRLIKFIPYPVIGGFMNGVALLIMLSQLPVLVGLPMGSAVTAISFDTLTQHLPDLGAGLATMAGAALAPRIDKRLPALLFGIVAGVAVYFGLLRLGLPASPDGLLRPIPGRLPVPLAPFAGFDGSALLVSSVLTRLLVSALVLAVVGSIDSLLSAVVLDNAAETKHDSRRELVGQGLGNVVGALIGATASAGSTMRGISSWRAGGRTRRAALFQSLAVLLVLAAAPLMAYLPLSVFAGMMLVTAVSLLDGWSHELVFKLADAHERRHVLGNLLVVLAVALVTVFFNLAAALAVGVVGAATLFLLKASRGVVRQIHTGSERRSLRVRRHDQVVCLAEHGSRIVVVELEGALFFGTADPLEQQVLQLARPGGWVILDLKRLTEMDATGARILQHLGRALDRRNCVLCLSYLTPDSAHGRFLRDMGVDRVIPGSRWLVDTDHALEAAEDYLLATVGVSRAEGEEIALEAVSVFEGLDAQEIALLRGYLQEQHLERGALLFREGEAGDRLYLLTRGEVSITFSLDAVRVKRLATYGPGVVFGEMALLEGKPRSADARMTTDGTVYSLSDDALRQVIAEHPGVAGKLMLNMGREIAARLRVTNAELRLVEQ